MYLLIKDLQTVFAQLFGVEAGDVHKHDIHISSHPTDSAKLGFEVIGHISATNPGDFVVISDTIDSVRGKLVKGKLYWHFMIIMPCTLV